MATFKTRNSRNIKTGCNRKHQSELDLGEPPVQAEELHFNYLRGKKATNPRPIVTIFSFALGDSSLCWIICQDGVDVCDAPVLEKLGG